MPVGATIAAVSTVASAGIGYAGAKSAAKTQAKAAENSADIQLGMFNQTRADLAPFRSFGTSALSPYARLLGLDTGASGVSPAGTAFTPVEAGGAPDFAAYGAANADLQAAWQDIVNTGNGEAFGHDPNNYYAWHWNKYGQNEVGQPGSVRVAPPTTGGMVGSSLIGGSTGGGMSIQQQLESLPGYQFARDQGILSAQRSIGSRGLTGSQLKGVARFVTGLADQTYGEQVTRLNQAATLGSNAAAQTGNIGAQTGASIGQSLIGAGTASAAGTVGATNAVTGGINNLSNLYLGNRLLNGGGGMYDGGSMGRFLSSGGLWGG